MKFTQDIIERIRDGNPIASVIGEYISIERRQGRRYWACCPFHHEKTPSFSIAPDQGFFYCFGCHKGGDVFRFVQEYEHCSFPEAVEKLANRIHFTLPERDLSPAEKERMAYMERLREVCSLAATYYHNCLTKTALGEKARAYWQNRGMTTDTIVQYRLGYAPNEWNRLYRDFTARGYDEKILVDAGLCINKEGKIYDRFRDRVMFAIEDTRGRVVAFGGRTLGDGEPKYLNSPETKIFNKRRLLYGYAKALPTIRQTEQVILVEGYMDTVALHQAGCRQVVASLGTALTEEQVRLLKRSAKEGIIAYDMDQAGRNATQRAIEIANKIDWPIRVLTLPQGKDPDEYVKGHGLVAWETQVSAAKPALEYQMEEIIARHDIRQVAGKEKVVAEVLPLLARANNAIVIDGYLSQLAQELHMNEEVVRSQAQQYFHQHQKEVYIAPVDVGVVSSPILDEYQARLEEYAMVILLTGHPQRDEFISALTVDDFVIPLCRKCFQYYQENDTDEAFRAETQEEETMIAAWLVREEERIPMSVTELVKSLEKARLQRAYDDCIRTAQACQEAGDEEGMRQAIDQGLHLQQQLQIYGQTTRKG